MAIVATLYIFLVWLIFFKLKLLPWTRPSQVTVAIVGVLLLAVVLALLNFYTPSGRIAVVSRVVEITPNVSGRVTHIYVVPNAPVNEGDPLFQIDPKPFEFEVARLKAALAEAKTNVEQMATSLNEANANVAATRAELELAELKLRDIRFLVERATRSKVELEKAETEVASLQAQLRAAEARAASARLELGPADPDGPHSTVAQISAQLDKARWDLDQTTILAPSDGFVSGLTLGVGHRATKLRSAVSFIEGGRPRIIGVFPQSGFRRIMPGVEVRIAFSSDPGRVYVSTVTEVLSGIGEGQFTASGVLPNMSAVGTTSEYGVRIAIPDDVASDRLRIGMSGTATVFAEDAGAIAILAKILLWLKAQLLYL